MARLKKETIDNIHAAIQAAVDDGANTPSKILDYLLDNGCDPMPTRATVISVMNTIGFVYVEGRWERPQ